MRVQHYFIHTESMNVGLRHANPACLWMEFRKLCANGYGSGLRVSAALRLRMQDIDFNMKQISVRSGKGDKDRGTIFPSSIIPTLTC
jgi:site-specific recombinase XerC